MTPREQLYYNNWLEITDDIREEGFAEGEQIGHERGARENAIENAKNALAMGLSAEQVAQITSLSLEQVLSIRKSMENL